MSQVTVVVPRARSVSARAAPMPDRAPDDQCQRLSTVVHVSPFGPVSARPYPAGGDRLVVSSPYLGGPVAKVNHAAIAAYDVEAGRLRWHRSRGIEPR